VGVLWPAAIAGWSNRLACDRSDDTRAPELVMDVVAPLGENATLLTMEWQFYSPCK
jgi:hypothetical protein